MGLRTHLGKVIKYERSILTPSVRGQIALWIRPGSLCPSPVSNRVNLTNSFNTCIGIIFWKNCYHPDHPNYFSYKPQSLKLKFSLKSNVNFYGLVVSQFMVESDQCTCLLLTLKLFGYHACTDWSKRTQIFLFALMSFKVHKIYISDHLWVWTFDKKYTSLPQTSFRKSCEHYRGIHRRLKKHILSYFS